MVSEIANKIKKWLCLLRRRYLLEKNTSIVMKFAMMTMMSTIPKAKHHKTKDENSIFVTFVVSGVCVVFSLLLFILTNGWESAKTVINNLMFISVSGCKNSSIGKKPIYLTWVTRTFTLKIPEKRLEALNSVKMQIARNNNWTLEIHVNEICLLVT